MIRADLVTSIVLLALGLATMVESWRMPRFEDVGADVWSSPGVVPGLLGAALSLMALILLLRSVAALRRPAGGPGGDGAGEGGWGRAALAVGLCLVYAVGLVGRVPFWLATFLFAFAFVTAFDLLAAGPRPPVARIVLVAALVAAATAVAVPAVFQSVFLVRLP
jgi:putative tricarboxylic transport membrane protein